MDAIQEALGPKIDTAKRSVIVALSSIPSQRPASMDIPAVCCAHNCGDCSKRVSRSRPSCMAGNAYSRCCPSLQARAQPNNRLTRSAHNPRVPQLPSEPGTFHSRFRIIELASCLPPSIPLSPPPASVYSKDAIASICAPSSAPPRNTRLAGFAGPWSVPLQMALLSSLSSKRRLRPGA